MIAPLKKTLGSVASDFLVGRVGIYLGASILSSAIPFLLLPILTRILSPEDYGIISMFVMLTSFFGAFTGLSVHGAISVRYFQLGREELAEYITACVCILLFSCAALLLLVMVSGELFEAFTGVPSLWVSVAVVVTGFQFLVNIRLALWQAASDAASFGKFQVAQSAADSIASIALVVMLGLAWQGRTLGLTLSAGAFGCLALWSISRRYPLGMSIRWRRHVRDALAFGVPLIPHVLGSVLVVAVDRVVIVRMLDVSSAGIYMVAFQVGQILDLVARSINKAYAPWLIERLATMTSGLALKVVHGSYLIYALMLTLGALLGFAAPWVLKILAGDSFQEASPLVIYMALGFGFGGCYYMVANYIFYESKTWMLSIVTLISGLLHIPLTILLVKINGLVGAAQAFTLSQALVFVGTWWVAAKVHPMPWFRKRKTVGQR